MHEASLISEAIISAGQIGSAIFTLPLDVLLKPAGPTLWKIKSRPTASALYNKTMLLGCETG